MQGTQPLKFLQKDTLTLLSLSWPKNTVLLAALVFFLLLHSQSSSQCESGRYSPRCWLLAFQLFCFGSLSTSLWYSESSQLWDYRYLFSLMVVLCFLPFGASTSGIDKPQAIDNLERLDL